MEGLTIDKLTSNDLDIFKEVIRLFEQVFAQANKDEDQAMDFYRSTRPTEEENVLHFYYSLHRDPRS